MRELLLINGCAGLAYSAVALLVWWVRDEGRDTPVTKVLTRRMKMSPGATSTEPAGLLTVALLAKSELAARNLSVSAGTLRVPAEKCAKCITPG